MARQRRTRYGRCPIAIEGRFSLPERERLVVPGGDGNIVPFKFRHVHREHLEAVGIGLVAHRSCAVHLAVQRERADVCAEVQPHFTWPDVEPEGAASISGLRDYLAQDRLVAGAWAIVGGGGGGETKLGE